MDPISRAALRSCATARIARPGMVRVRNRPKASDTRQAAASTISRDSPICTGPMATDICDTSEFTDTLTPREPASTRFSSTISSPKVAKICIIGSPCNGRRMSQ